VKIDKNRQLISGTHSPVLVLDQGLGAIAGPFGPEVYYCYHRYFRLAGCKNDPDPLVVMGFAFYGVLSFAVGVVAKFTFAIIDLAGLQDFPDLRIVNMAALHAAPGMF
jgi:hypothetical protein